MTASKLRDYRSSRFYHDALKSLVVFARKVPIDDTTAGA
jgi:hypothetical protein